MPVSETRPQYSFVTPLPDGFVEHFPYGKNLSSEMPITLGAQQRGDGQNMGNAVLLTACKTQHQPQASLPEPRLRSNSEETDWIVKTPHKPHARKEETTTCNPPEPRRRSKRIMGKEDESLLNDSEERDWIVERASKIQREHLISQETHLRLEKIAIVKWELILRTANLRHLFCVSDDDTNQGIKQQQRRKLIEIFRADFENVLREDQHWSSVIMGEDTSASVRQRHVISLIQDYADYMHIYFESKPRPNSQIPPVIKALDRFDGDRNPIIVNRQSDPSIAEMIKKFYHEMRVIVTNPDGGQSTMTLFQLLVDGKASCYIGITSLQGSNWMKHEAGQALVRSSRGPRYDFFSRIVGRVSPSGEVEPFTPKDAAKELDFHFFQLSEDIVFSNVIAQESELLKYARDVAARFDDEFCLNRKIDRSGYGGLKIPTDDEWDEVEDPGIYHTYAIVSFEIPVQVARGDILLTDRKVTGYNRGDIHEQLKNTERLLQRWRDIYHFEYVGPGRFLEIHDHPSTTAKEDEEDEEEEEDDEDNSSSSGDDNDD